MIVTKLNKSEECDLLSSEGVSMGIETLLEGCSVREIVNNGEHEIVVQGMGEHAVHIKKSYSSIAVVRDLHPEKENTIHFTLSGKHTDELKQAADFFELSGCGGILAELQYHSLSTILKVLRECGLSELPPIKRIKEMEKEEGGAEAIELTRQITWKCFKNNLLALRVS